MRAHSNMPSITETLIERCKKPVDDATRHRASVHLLDWLGCILAGQQTESGQSLRRYSEKFTPYGGAAFNVTGTSLCALEAAFINGGLGNILELDDVHRQSILHTGDTVMPAALAVAQEGSASMELLLDAIVKGYEVAIEIGSAAASGGYSAWYNSSTCGVFGAGMAACVLMQLSDEESLDALGQCGMLASGLWQCRLESSSSKQLATAHAARSGVMAAMLASQHFPGPRQILEGELGFFKTLYPSVSIDQLISDDEKNWRIGEVSFKPWPACRHTHPVIEAALALAPSIDVRKILSIEIGSYRSGLDFCDNAAPTSDHEARFSMQHCVASALLRGNPELSHFNDKARAEPDLLTLMQCTRVIEDPELQQAFPGLFGGCVTVKLHDGSMHTKLVKSAWGDPENPMGLTDIQHKFSTLAATAGINEVTIQALLSHLTEQDDHATLSVLNEDLQAIEHQLEERRRATQ